MRFRNRVRLVRERRGLSVAALARQSGVSTQTIFDLERDDGHAPRGMVQVKLCEALADAELFWVEPSLGERPVAEAGA